MLLPYLAVAWAAGIAVASLVQLPLSVWAWWSVLPAGLFLIWRRDANLRRMNVLLLAFLLAAVRYTSALPQFDDHSLATYNDHDTLLLVGDVIDPPELRDRSLNIRLAVTRLRLGTEWREVNGVALVNAPRETDARYGDQLQIFGEPTTPPDEPDFSYKDYLARQGIHSLVRVYGGVKILARDQGNPFYTALYAFKDRGVATIYAILPDPAASLLAGILLGVDAGIPRDVTDAFSATNTAHIVAISGFNISIVAGILAQFSKRLVGAKRATLIVIGGLAVYTLLVGASASVVRAAIMGSLSVIALHYRRQNDALNTLCAAALGMLVLNPFWLYDMGFQLSFLATLGLVMYVTPLTAAFENFFVRLTSNARAKQMVGVLNDSFIVTLAAQITTTPLIAFAFHRFSLIGLLTNFIVLPVQPAVMIWGGLAMFAGMIFQPAGQLIGWFAWTVLEFTIVVVQATAALPFAAFDVAQFDMAILFVYYAALFTFAKINWQPLRVWLAQIFRKRASVSRAEAINFPIAPSLALGVVLICGMWIWSATLTLPDGKTHVEFFEGGSTLVRTPNGTRVLIDGGANPSVVLSALGERMPFWDRAVDVLALTRADDAHRASLIATLERYAVRQIIQVDAPAKPTAADLKWHELLMRQNVPTISARAGTRLNLDRDVAFEIAYLADVAVPRLRVGTLAILLADDASPDLQAALRASTDDLTSAVLVVPRKIMPDFVAQVNPQIAIVLGGNSARDSLAPDALAALANATLLQTADRGVIELILNGQTVAIKTQK